MPGLQSAIDAGLAFLESQYNPDYGLLQESPNVGQYRYYLTNDNALAAYVTKQMGDNDLANRLRTSLDRYGYHSNGFVEVAWGEVIAWPPIHHKDLVVEQVTDAPCDFLNEDETGPVGDCLLLETHTPDLGVFYDWSSFSNLACMGAVNEHNKGNAEVARWLYRTQMSTFDGNGWPDVAWLRRDGVYETIGLTWCLYAGALIGEPVNEQALSQLLAQQDPVSGGFHTHYRTGQPRLADPNVETTSLALLALGLLGGRFQPGTSSPVSAIPASGPATPMPEHGDLQPIIETAGQFLIEQYNPDLYLLRESRVVAPDRHWLATDNLLATYAFDAAGVPQMADRIRYGLAKHADVHHGLIEALIGEPVDWPPHVEIQSEVAPGVWMERRVSGDQYQDWADYTDLALYGALVAHNRGDDALARARYQQALAH